MKPRRKFLLTRSALAGLAGWLALAGLQVQAAERAPAAGGPTGQGSMASRFKQVEERIAALFQHRDQPPPPIEPRHNPFRPPGSAPLAPPVSSDTPELPRPPAGSDYSGLSPGASLALLQQGAATLKVSGIFEIGGRAHLVINARPYKEGDVVQAQVRGETVYLRVKEIARRSVTLALNEAEMTLKF
jgi:hypothetical protein